jgi:plastocyanin
MSSVSFALVLVAVLLMGARAYAADTLYQRLGGEEGIAAISNQLIDRAVADPVAGRSFKDVKLVPAINVVRTGTAVSFPNSDHIRHQVYSFSAAKTFSLKLYAGSPKTEVVFDKPGLVVLGCNIHDSMAAFLAVVDSPYFAKVPASGALEFALPPGRYRLRLWHPALDAPVAPRDITVGEAALRLPLVVDLAARESVALWPE